MGPISNIDPKTSWAARDRPDQYLEEISRRNAAGRLAGRRPPPPRSVRRSDARLPQRVRRMARDAPTSGASSGRNQQPPCANQQASVGGRSCNNCTRYQQQRSTISRPPFRNQCADQQQEISRHARLARNIGYPRMKASGESSTTKHRLLHASGPHPIPPPNVPKVSMTFRVVWTNQYNQDLGLIHSTNGNHLESPNEGSSIDHQVTIHLHAQNITMFPTNETWYFTSQILVSSSGGLILILTAQSTRNEFRIHSDY
ncbi:hypothetical protein F511_32509 [Dorcoceras hygrometricum]|uniref:Uncharacterized protein n=1 Tax=Dorcoceras hygrometricum TaxID=472368 RepID=A0A2Z7C491_9LAMI|nr:hypothetical protein F511_32509 [Dorcoceras hygrometricum]